MKSGKTNSESDFFRNERSNWALCMCVLFSHFRPSDVLMGISHETTSWLQVRQCAVLLQFETSNLNPLTAEWVLRALIDFTLSNARRFYSSMGYPLAGKGLTFCYPISEQSRDVNPRNGFFQMASYEPAYVHITWKNKKKILEIIMWSEMWKYDVQDEKVYWTNAITEI